MYDRAMYGLYRSLNEQFAQRMVVISHAGQLGSAGFRDKGIIKADNGDILRNPDISFPQDMGYAHRGKIIDGDDRRRQLQALLQEIRHHSCSILHIVGAAFQNILLPYRYSIFLQLFPINSPFIHGRSDGTVASGKKDSFMPVFMQIFHHKRHGFFFIYADPVAVRAFQPAGCQKGNPFRHPVHRIHIFRVRNQLVHLSANLDNSIHSLAVKFIQIVRLHAVIPK